MRIIQVIDTLKIGGAEKLLLTFAEELQHTDHHVTIVTLKPVLDGQKDVAESMGIRVVEFPGSKIYDLPRLLRVYKFIRKESPDIVHTHLSMGTIIGVIVARLAGAPAVTSIHNTEFNSNPHSIRSRAETWITNHLATGVIAVGRAVEEQHRRRLRKHRIKIIPNAASAPHSQSGDPNPKLRSLLTNHSDGVVITAVGRLTEQKAHSVLLKAFALVVPEYPNAALVIVGRGHLMDALVADSKALGILEDVSFLGFRQDVPAILSVSDIYVNSSLWEGMPISTLEAMSYGVPCVITETGDASDLLRATPEYVCRPNHVQDLAAKLMALVDSPEARRLAGDAMRTTFDAEYTPTAWVGRVLRYYEGVVDEFRKPS